MRAVPLEVLRPLFDDERVTEVLVNGPGAVWVERDGAHTLELAAVQKGAEKSE